MSALPSTQKQILLCRRPHGVPVAEDFALGEGPVPTAVGPGQVLLRQIYLSLDPAIRGWMSESKSYLPPIAIGAPVRSGTLSQVVLSSVPEWQPGDLCQALAAWEEYSLVPAEQLMGKITPVPGIPLSSMLNVLGGNGLTAYFGLYDVGRPEAGETVLVKARPAGGGAASWGSWRSSAAAAWWASRGLATSASGCAASWASTRRSTTRAPT
ncbi:MAG: hypothetical protein IPG17_26570 [Sandaracinaceae bacterium]|nr:hypothetical protein [Sandaracinaceae bacterium]